MYRVVLLNSLLYTVFPPNVDPSPGGRLSLLISRRNTPSDDRPQLLPSVLRRDESSRIRPHSDLAGEVVDEFPQSGPRLHCCAGLVVVQSPAAVLLPAEWLLRSQVHWRGHLLHEGKVVADRVLASTAHVGLSAGKRGRRPLCQRSRLCMMRPHRQHRGPVPGFAAGLRSPSIRSSAAAHRIAG